MKKRSLNKMCLHELKQEKKKKSPEGWIVWSVKELVETAPCTKLSCKYENIKEQAHLDFFNKEI